MNIFESHIGLFLQALDVKKDDVQAKGKAACRHDWARWRDGHASVERYYTQYQFDIYQDVNRF